VQHEGGYLAPPSLEERLCNQHGIIKILWMCWIETKKRHEPMLSEMPAFPEGTTLPNRSRNHGDSNGLGLSECPLSQLSEGNDSGNPQEGSTFGIPRPFFGGIGMSEFCNLWRCPEDCTPCYKEVCQYVASLPKTCATCLERSYYPCTGQLQQLPSHQII